MSTTKQQSATLFGHPTALFVLYFAEMWERFSYYGMRSLLVFYMIKGFLGYNDGEAYRVYGAYAGLVYMTPFIGGMIADRLIGARRAVVLGGVLMSLGHLVMTFESSMTFYMALALLIVGNGFFKPNISTMVGDLYGEQDPRRDSGFTLFYMGINLGAALAPLLCGYVGETYGWHYGFGLATVGMMIGLAVFIMPTLLSQILIVGGALATSVSMVFVVDGTILLLVNGFVALALIVSAVVAFAALQKGGLPAEAGQPRNSKWIESKVMGIRVVPLLVYAGAILSTPIFALLVFSNLGFRIIPVWIFAPLTNSTRIVLKVIGIVLAEMSTLPGMLLFVMGILATSYLLIYSLISPKVERQRLWVVVVLMFFSMLFWAFFEQGGTSMNNFTDRNVDRVQENRVVLQEEVGQTIEIELNQEQIGLQNDHPEMKGMIVAALEEIDAGQSIAFVQGQSALTMTGLDALREVGRTKVKWTVREDNVGMGIEGSEIPASTYQSANAIFILIFGLIFTGIWSWLAARGREPSTPVKFGLGLLQLGLGFAVLWWGAQVGDARGMTSMSWLLIGYLLFTTGELCLSPVGLSMVTKLSPKPLVSTVMGAWFLATAFSSLLASIIATFTGVGHGDGASSGIPVPSETLHVYGDVFGVIAILIGIATLIIFVLSPILSKWMHQDVEPGASTTVA